MGPLPDLGRPIQIATPCCGVDAGDDFWICGVPYQVCNVYDIISGYRETLETLLLERTGCKPTLHLGPTEAISCESPWKN